MFIKALTFLIAVSLPILVSAHQSDTQISSMQRQSFESGLVAKSDRDNAGAKTWTIAQRLAHHQVAGASVAIINNYQISWVSGYGLKQVGKDELIDEETVFSVGSVSKMVNATIIMRLVAEGRIDLDTDVNQYLTSWKVADSRYTKERKVTLRMILSHTAGFSQHGFADFYPGEALPTAIQTLNGETPAKHGPVRLMFTPGSEMDYSGGGTTVSQVLIEDVTGLSYEQAAIKYVFKPLGMTRSTFSNPLPATYGNIAKAHDRKGKPTALPRGYEAMPEIAASGLWTTATDLARLVIALMTSTTEKNGFLPQHLAKDMMTRVENSWHGLGPRINGAGQSYVFHHGGANNSYRAWMEGHINNGSGIVVLTNGTNGGNVFSEIRKSAEDTFNWPVKAKTGFKPAD